MAHPPELHLRVGRAWRRAGHGRARPPRRGTVSWLPRPWGFRTPSRRGIEATATRRDVQSNTCPPVRFPTAASATSGPPSRWGH